MKATWCEWMRRWSLIVTVATFIYFWFVTYPAAKAGLRLRDFSEAGTALWVFLILGAIIILLQLIPAILMFFSLVGSGASTLKSKKKVEEEIPITGCCGEKEKS